MLSDAKQSILYLENKGDSYFSPSYVNEAVTDNWLTMDVADFNEDGFKDVILGSYYFTQNAKKELLEMGNIICLKSFFYSTKMGARCLFESF